MNLKRFFFFFFKFAKLLLTNILLKKPKSKSINLGDVLFKLC